MELEVKKSNIDTEYNPDSGVRCLLYEARKNSGTQASDEALLKHKLQEINPKFAPSWKEAFSFLERMGYYIRELTSVFFTNWMLN